MASTLRDEAQAVQESQAGRCKIGTILGELLAHEGDDAEALCSLMGDRSISGATIAKVLTNRGYPVTESAVRRCRQHDCWKEL